MENYKDYLSVDCTLLSTKRENFLLHHQTLNMFTVYILQCSDKTLYVGSTNDLEKRLHQHNNLKSGAHYTKIRRPVVLKYSETVSSFSEARKREAEIKSWKKEKKIELIANLK